MAMETIGGGGFPEMSYFLFMAVAWIFIVL
jgi:hypothetical protein